MKRLPKARLEARVVIYGRLLKLDKLDALSLEEITIPQFWDYDEDWCNKNIAAKFDLDRICRHANASFEICYFIYGYGLEIHTNVRWLNKKIESVKNGKLYSLNSTEINSFLDNLCRPSSGYWWSNLSDLPLRLEMVNYELAPKKVLDVVSIPLSLLEQGTKTHKLVEKYVKGIQEAKRIEEREQSEAKRDELRRLSYNGPKKLDSKSEQNKVSKRTCANITMRFTKRKLPKSY